ncbi:Fc.00g048800.m01.CDS01 [Cosmosporella sp. VM-42]
MLASHYTQDRPGNWFIDGDGTCGSTPDSVITSKGAFVGFFALAIVLAAVAGALNFISLIKKAEQKKLFKHGIYKQAVIDVIASVITPILAATLFKQDEDTYTKHNFHVIAWVVFFGFRPGAMMGLLQVFGDELNSAAAAGQMIADMAFPIAGCVLALGSENGSVIPVADGANRARRHQRDNLRFNVTYHGVQIKHYPPPLSESNSHTDEQLVLGELQLLQAEKTKKLSIHQQKSAAFILLSPRRMDSNLNDSQILESSAAIGEQSDVLKVLDDFLNNPMQQDGIGNQVFLAPPFIHQSPKHDGPKMQLEKMQSWLYESEHKLNMHVAWSIPHIVDVQHKRAWANSKDTHSLEIVDGISEAQANILLNIRCNAKLQRAKGFPYTRTCCNDYGGQPMTQLVIVAVGVLYLTICVICETLDLIARRSKPRWQAFNMQIGAFILACLLCYYADRTQMFAKGVKVRVPYKDQLLFCAPFLIATVLTIRKSKPPPSKSTALVRDTNQPFLGRDQTEEWKGWMQWCILLWHWTRSMDTAHVEVHAFIRLLIAAYLFQTGYNHTSFFLAKKDFSIRRFSAVVLRLNLLSIALSYFMGANMWFYYFAPLSTFWFVVTYITMASFNKSMNGDWQSVACKIICSAILIGIPILNTEVIRLTISHFQAVFNVHWSAGHAQYRIRLDVFIPFFGMLAATTNHFFKEPIRPSLRYVLALAGVVIMGYCGWATAVYPRSSVQYEVWQPFISFIPVTAYVAVRNFNNFARNYSSRAMVWLGRCSLETYILQAHLFLAADFGGVLLIDGLQGGDFLLGRWRSVLIIMPVFMWLSSHTATATTTICNMIINAAIPKEEVVKIPLSSRDADDDDLVVESLLEKPKTSLFGVFSSKTGGWMTNLQVPSARWFFQTVQGRMVLMLLTLWLLNLMSPWPPKLSVP